MPLTAASGCISLAEQAGREILAASSTFQAWTDSEDAADALAHIYTDALPPPTGAAAYHTLAELQGYRPYAIISTDTDGEGYKRDQDAMGTDSFEFTDSGRLELLLCQDVNPDDAADPAEIARTSKNTMGNILDDLCAEAGKGGRLAIRSLGTQGPFRSHPKIEEDQGDFLDFHISIGW